jgi:hypothetical protein
VIAVGDVGLLEIQKGTCVIPEAISNEGCRVDRDYG